jgi:hypothetical protein
LPQCDYIMFLIFNSGLKTHYFDDNYINVNNLVKFLGIFIDHNISWRPLFDKLGKKFNSICFQIYILRETLHLKIRLMVYHACFASLLLCGVELWGNSSEASAIFKIKKYIFILCCFYKNINLADQFSKN